MVWYDMVLYGKLMYSKVNESKAKRYTYLCRKTSTSGLILVF
jgi:hypothetical protein